MKKQAKAVAVYAHLDGTFVPAGMLVYHARGRASACTFSYMPAYLEDGRSFPIDPVLLPLKEGVFETPQDSEYFGGVRDACPGAWGSSLLELAALDAGAGLEEMDYVLHPGADRAGALGFSASFGIPPFSEVPPWLKADWTRKEGFSLENLALAAQKAALGEAMPQVWRGFYACGSALGGARPKAAVRLGGEAFVAKLPHPDDQWRACRAEAAWMRLAADCGINAAQTACRTGSDGLDVLLVRRFDREPGWLDGGAGRRIPFVSEATLCALPEHAPDGSYRRMAQAMDMPFYDPSAARGDRLELFRRMCFNALAGNCDDHVRNHGFLLGRGGWRLSPAYDVAPCISPGGLQSSQRMGLLGNAMTKENLLSETQFFDLAREEAEAVFGRMAAQIASGWEDALLRSGMPRDELPLMAPCCALAMQESGAAPALEASSGDFLPRP